MPRKPSVTFREVAALERIAMDETILAMAEAAPSVERVQEFRGTGVELDYEAAGWAGAMTLLVWARRIAHVEAGVRG